MAVALDSDVVVGFLDRTDALHEAADDAIREFATSEPIVVSVITYAEVLTGARIGRHRLRDVRGFFGEVVSRIVAADVEVAERASELRARARALRMPDALIVATAESEPDVDILLSADRDLAKLRGLRCKLRLISPSD